MTIQSYDNIASIFNNMNMPDSALHYIDLGNRMLRRMIPDNITLKILLDLNEAKTRFKLGQVDRALKIAKRAEEANLRFTDEYWEPSIYRFLSMVYESKGNKDLAFSYLKKISEGI